MGTYMKAKKGIRVEETCDIEKQVNTLEVCLDLQKQKKRNLETITSNIILLTRSIDNTSERFCNNFTEPTQKSTAFWGM